MEPILDKYSGSDEEVMIPDEVTRMDNDAFKDNNTMRKVIQPDFCETLLVSIFPVCSNLQEVVINGKNIFLGIKLFCDDPLVVYGYSYGEDLL